jgi:hypothetical protein
VVRYGGGNEWNLDAQNSRQMAQLRRICNEVDPTRPFHDPDPETFAQRHGPHWYHVAPRHQDNHYQLYNTGYPLTLGPDNPLEWTEYGAAGAASVETLKRIMPEVNLWPIRSDDPYWIWHKGLWAFMGENWLAPSEYEYLFGKLPDLETMVRCSQFAQAEGLRYANQAHRRHQWHRSAFVSWTYNEPWPNAAHGCIVEHYGRTKMAYYYAKQSCAPVDISGVYSGLSCGPEAPLNVEVWISNDHEKLPGHRVRWRLYDAQGELCAEQTEVVEVPAENSTKITVINWTPEAEMVGDVVLLYLELLDPDRAVMARNLYTFGIAAQEPKSSIPPGLRVCEAQTITTNPKIKIGTWQTATSPIGSYDVITIPEIAAGTTEWAREWRPGVNGKFHLYGSWGACPRHAEKVQYVIDRDGDFNTGDFNTGDFNTKDDQSSATIDERLLADQTTAAAEPGTWSGFRCLGTFELGEASAVRLVMLPQTEGRFLGGSLLAIQAAGEKPLPPQLVSQPAAPLRPLLKAPATELRLRATGWRDMGVGGIVTKLEVANVGSNAALFVELRAEVPSWVRVYYADNYFFLPPGERRRIEVTLLSGQAGRTLRPPILRAQAWNSPPSILDGGSPSP